FAGVAVVGGGFFFVFSGVILASIQLRHRKQ
ncbi:MAG: hypothetical protein ACI90V_008036, partial [Bacillariaceae sp.]